MHGKLLKYINRSARIVLRSISNNVSVLDNDTHGPIDNSKRTFMDNHYRFVL